MSIQEHLNKIRNAIKGSEVRESIAKGIETAYDDASEKDNANMEVKIARGTNPNLNTRLNNMDATDSQNTKKIDSNYQEVTAQLAQTEQEVMRKRELEDLSPTVLSAIEGGEGTSFDLLSIPQDDSVNYQKLNPELRRNVSFPAENLVRNGDFSDGINHWGVNSSSIEVINEGLLVTGTNPLPQARIEQSVGEKLSQGDVMYIKATVKLLNPAREVRVRYPESTSSDYLGDTRFKGIFVDPPVDEYFDVIHTVKIGRDFDPYQLRLSVGHYHDTVEESKNTEMIVENVMTLNLTKVFGKGNELEADDVTEIVNKHPNSWFQFTNNLVNIQDIYSNQLKLSKNSESLNIDTQYIKNEVLASEHPTYKNVLDIIPPDGNPNICHPSVVKIEGGFAGYVYWMVYTPYPDSDRENPHIVASHNGVDWEEPTGIENPVVSYEYIQDIGYYYNSDTTLIYVDGKLELYYRAVRNPASLGESIIRRTSENGIDWVDETVVLEPGILGNLSPAVVYENGQYTMWGVNMSEQPYTMYKRTSSDGINYGEPVKCNFDGFDKGNLWHFSVVKVDGLYHMLVSEHWQWNLFYAYSEDGVNWKIEASHNVIPLPQGDDFKSEGFYHATLVPTYGKGVEFDIWANVLIKGTSGNSPDSQHRLAYYKGVDLVGGAKKLTPKDVNKLLIPSTDFQSTYGTNEFKILSQQMPYRSMAKESGETLVSILHPPKFMKRVKFKLHWTNLSEDNLGSNVKWRIVLSKATTGYTLVPVAYFEGASKTVSVGEVNVLTTTDLFDRIVKIDLEENQFLFIELRRRETDEEDTALNDVGFIGLELEYVD